MFALQTLIEYIFYERTLLRASTEFSERTLLLVSCRSLLNRVCLPFRPVLFRAKVIGLWTLWIVFNASNGCATWLERRGSSISSADRRIWRYVWRSVGHSLWPQICRRASICMRTVMRTFPLERRRFLEPQMRVRNLGKVRIICQLFKLLTMLKRWMPCFWQFLNGLNRLLQNLESRYLKYLYLRSPSVWTANFGKFSMTSVY